MSKCKQDDDVDLDDKIGAGDLDHLCYSKKSSSSIDQPENGVRSIVATGKWSLDEGLLSLINTADEPVELPKLVKLDGTRVKIVVAVHSNTFTVG